MVADQNVFVSNQEQHFICPLSDPFVLFVYEKKSRTITFLIAIIKNVHTNKMKASGSLV